LDLLNLEYIRALKKLLNSWEKLKNSFRKEVKEGVSDRETGVVKWFNATKGYGFIVRDAGGDIFVHHSTIQSQDYRMLFEGQRVEFSVVQGKKGLQAQNVEILA